MSKENILKVIDPIYDENLRTIEWDSYLALKQRSYCDLDGKQIEAHLISEANWMLRKKATSCEQFSINIKVGNICFIDYGTAYLNEAGYQHFGLILSIVNSKAFVVPLSSNPYTLSQAYDEVSNPNGKKHLMKLGKVKGLYKESVLFINDSKFINTARIIDVKAYLNPKGEMFKKIKKRVLNCLDED